MNDMRSIFAAALVKPAIKRFIEQYPEIHATFAFEGDNVRITLHADPGPFLVVKPPISEVVFTPDQQGQIAIEFTKIVMEGSKK